MKKKYLSYLLPLFWLLLLVGCKSDGTGNEESGSIISPVESSESASSESESEESFESIPTMEENIQALVDEMTLEEKVGQMFLVRFPDEDAAYLADNYHLGGYIWFAKDFSEKTPEIVQAEIQEMQEVMTIDLFMAVDEEGGDVTRISSFEQFRTEPFHSPQEAFAWNGWEGIKAEESEKASLLKTLGFNLNLAPVADVPESESDFIYSRSFSTDPNDVSTFVTTVVEISKEEKVGSVLKHFPGYGNNIDTHTGIAYDERDYQSFVARDFLPFEAGIHAGVPAILMSHNVMMAIDETVPATLSPQVNQVLRDELGFDGVIMTDDLIMDGLRLFTEADEAAVLAVLAGNDILISSEFTIQLPAVLEAVEAGRISEERIDESVSRILKMKMVLDMID